MQTTTTTTTTTTTKVVKYNRPKDIRLSQIDRFGCMGYEAYGHIEYTDGHIVHIRNADYDFRGTRPTDQE